MITDNKGYVGAIMLVMSTIMIAFMIFIGVMPVCAMLHDSFSESLAGNQFYSTKLADRLDMGESFGWKAPFGFIAIGFIYAVLRTIKRQQYTEYEG